jgi:hypothetical protein
MRLSLLLSVVTLAGKVVFAQDTSPGAPVHEGQPANCNGWHTVVSGDDCQSVPTKYGITFDNFLKWNPAVSRDCLTNFWLGQAYCVRIGTVSSSSKTPTSTTTTSNTKTSSRPISTTTTVKEDYSTRHPTITFNITSTTIDMAWPPEKTKEGQPNDCVHWHLVAAGDDCKVLTIRYGISMDNL